MNHWLQKYSAFCIPPISVLCAAILTFALRQLSPQIVYFLFLFAIILIAMYSGRIAALAALVLSVVVIDFFFLPPYYQFSIETDQLILMAAFAFTSLIAIFLIVARTKALLEKLESLRRLSAALDRIGRLRTLLPACPSCHEVVDDLRYWDEVQKYLQKTRPAEWLCVNCSAKLFRERGGQLD